MKCLLLLVFGLLPLAFAQKNEVLKEFSAGYNRFTVDVYKKILKSKSGNMIVCPLSVDIILALALNGAQGKTAQELVTALRLPEGREKIHETFKAILPNLYSNENYNLSSANKIYIKNGSQINDQFNKVAVDVFKSEIQDIDFSKSKEVASEINRWAENKTDNKINELIRPDMINKETVMVLVNAIYFHGKWETAFNKQATAKYTFYRNIIDFVRTDMMVKIGYYNYYESFELNAKFLQLFYEGKDVSMHIVLPNELNSLADLEKKLSDALIPPRYTNVKVSIRIPKFKIESDIKFVPVLQEMGVKAAFGDEASFSDILANHTNIKLSEVLQKAIVEVDEDGTIGSVPTEIFLLRPQPILPKVFHAVRPFLFYLRLDKLGINLFVGRYTSPEKKDSKRCVNIINCGASDLLSELFSLALN